MTRRPLSQLTDWELVDEDQDLRGRKLLDPSGAPLGTIRDMIVDTDTGYVEAVLLDDGTAYAAREFELRRGAAVLLEPERGARAGPATPPPERAVRQRTSAGRQTPVPPVPPSAPPAPAPSPSPSPAGAGAPPRTATDPDTAPRPPSPADVPPDSPFGESRPIVITLRGEELYVDKVPVLAAEVVVTKQGVRFTERVSDTVRRERVEVHTERTPAAARGPDPGLPAGPPGTGLPTPRS